MPAVALVVPTGPPVTKRRVTLTSLVGVVTLDVTSPEATLDGFADEYATLNRPGRRPLLAHVGGQLRTLRLEATLDAGLAGTAVVEARLRTLAAIASPGQNRAVIVAYAPLEGSARITKTGQWNLTGLTIRTLRRKEGTNEVTRAKVELEFTEHAPAPGQSGTLAVGPPPAVPTGSSTAVRSGTGTVAAPAAPRSTSTRRHTVGAGQTLWAIATMFYGDGNQWTRIAEANSIRDPRTLAVGTILVIP